MTAIHFDARPARRPALLVSMITWLWPEPLSSSRRRVGALWWFASVAAIWPRPLQRDFARTAPMGYGGRRSSLALDRVLSRWWRVSWLWAWMWPGRLMGPDGEICPLVPWHPALKAQVCDAVPWRRRMARRGMIAGMMMSAAALAAPTLMEGNSALDGGRMSAFLGGGSAGEAGSGGAGDQGSGGGGAGDPGAGPGQTGPLTTFNPGNLTPPETQNSSFDPGQPPLAGGGGSGDGAGSGEGTAPSGGEGGLTFLDPPAGGEGGGGDGLGFGFGGGSGGGGGGGSGGNGAGGGFGGGGGGPGPGDGDLPAGPGEEILNPDGDDPFGPPDAPDDPFETPKDNPPPPSGSPGGPAGPFGGSGGGGGGGGPLFDGPQGGGGGPLDAPLAPVPEPQTWAMMILGFGAVGYLIRRRRARSHVHA